MTEIIEIPIIRTKAVLRGTTLFYPCLAAETSAGTGNVQLCFPYTPAL